MSGDAYIDLLQDVLLASSYDESAWRLVEGPMQKETGLTPWIKRSIVKALRKRDLLLVRKKRFDARLRESGLDWPLFGFTMVGKKRLENVRASIETVIRDGIVGDFVETGVWRGGTAIFAKALFKHHGANDRKVWCCDSFEGMPKPSKTDVSIADDSDFSDREFLAVSLEEVQSNFKKFGLLDENVRFIKGLFNESLPKSPISKISILRLDGDLFDSTMDSLRNIYDRAEQSGFIIVDDYFSWKGCRTAVDQFRTERGISDELVQIDAHAVMWRKS